tara:strand:+ start:604 stop:2664 length:2061 start_codon:yes stop_codon:yes gene_type:complete
VGPKRSSLLNNELSIFSFYDLLTFFPYRYIDRSKIHVINQINNFDVDIQIIGYVKSKQILGIKNKKRLVISFYDKTGFVDLIFFKQIKWINNAITIGSRYLVFGKPSQYGQRISFVHPEMELLDKATYKPRYTLYPVYHSTEKLSKIGLNSKGITKLMEALLLVVKHDIVENLSKDILEKYNFLHREKVFQSIHFPFSTTNLHKSIYRLKFEEFFFLQISLLKQQVLRKKQIKSFVFKNVGPKFNMFYHNHLSFNLTNAQKRVMREIRLDVLAGFQMNRLLQGDVGSGKTVIAIMSILLAHDNGYQSCLMAPTEILATQHFNSIMKFASSIDLKVALLTGKTKVSAKKKIISDLINNQVDLLIGTHALIEDNIVFHELGLAIIDEQHKFGVSQRAKLWTNKKVLPHVLVMTATPIPRTLAMTAYGDLDLSVIDELPPNRKKIHTIHKYEKQINEVFSFIKKELHNKKQIYIVYPLIEESKALDYQNLISGYNHIIEVFKNMGISISMVHGRLKKDEKLKEMDKFLHQKTQIMVATTVIEVGVNVPNATIMVIQNAERFGLSQLHQLRGRVGRGGDKSYCFLITSNKLTEDAKIRLNAMVDSGDGFKIAETDLKIRGPGDILGTRQSGLINFKIANLIHDAEILHVAREEARQLIDRDCDLSHSINEEIKRFFLVYHAKRLKWGSIS